MNEITAIFSDLPESEQKFAEVIINVVTSKHAVHEKDYQDGRQSECVPLENIHFGPDDFKGSPHVMQGIKPYQEVGKTVKQMLGSLLWTYREIEMSHGFYRLTKHGHLYRHLKEKLAG